MNNINSVETLELINKANNLSLKKGYNEISLERAVFLSWWCDKGDCKFCYMTTQKNKIKDPRKARRRVNNILAEAEMCSRLGWNIEFLSGGYKSFTTSEIKSIAEDIHSITGDGVWLNTGITDELEEYGEEIKGITGAVEAANPKFQKEVCPSKPLDQISNMLDKAGDLGFKKAINRSTRYFSTKIKIKAIGTENTRKAPNHRIDTPEIKNNNKPKSKISIEVA